MKLLTKLTLFITFSKFLIVAIFVLSLPRLVNFVSFRYSNYYLTQQKKKVLENIDKNGIDYYLQGDSAFGSYTLLKEEYISILPTDASNFKESIENAQRIIEEDTLDYRVLVHPLKTANRLYILEIGKTTAAIEAYNVLLQRFALLMLIALIVLSIIIDLLYTNILLRPLAKIVRTKLLDRSFPFKEPLEPVQTSTSDFKHLDQSLIKLMETIHDAFYKEREFTSNASHELMTPISILQNNIENLMLEEELPELVQDKLNGMMKTVLRLKKIVNALLYISRIENDQYAKNDVVQLKQLVQEVAEELAPGLELKGITFSNNIPNSLQIEQVNHDLFFQMIYNLINNAIRYNKENGSIEVRVLNRDDNDVELQIIDTGIGIAAAEIPFIFNRFKKLSQPEVGFGLGLAIVKSIAVFHKQNIEVSSVVGEGTTFSIQLKDASVIKE